MKTAYLTTPIYYVNNIPHIGHWYTSICTDVLHRANILMQYDARMQTGTDEHGQKIEKSAHAKNINTMLFCNEISEQFRKMSIYANLSCSYTIEGVNNFNDRDKTIAAYQVNSNTLFHNNKNFIRTTEGRNINDGSISENSLKSGRHLKTVIKFWNILKENGWIYKGKYSGWYAVRDEAFYAESEIVDGKAPSGAAVEWKEEECYFFRLSEFQKILLSLYKNNPQFIMPAEKYTEVMAFVSGMKFVDAQNGLCRGGALEDLCISRPGLKWGIPVPDEENQSIYVWLDALLNYISALEYESEDYRKYWLNRTSNSKVIHVVGKDILRFHCVYWPAFLIAEKIKFDDVKAINNLEISEIYNHIKPIINNLPNTVFAHGWWTNNGEKISKSLGNAINPYDEIEFIKSFEIDENTAVDYFRYFMIRAIAFGNDGDYSRENFVTTINADLANNIGNLIQRSISMIDKYLNKKVEIDSINFDNIIEFYEKFQPHEVINIALTEANTCNEMIDLHAPWKLAKDGKLKEIENIMNIIITKIFNIGVILQPILPTISARILEIFNINTAQKFNGLNMQNISINIISNICPRMIKKI